MAASQPNKATINWVDSDEEGEKPSWLEVGLRKVRECYLNMSLFYNANAIDTMSLL